MIVRLKETTPELDFVGASLFQFYDSPIKRMNKGQNLYKKAKFQFYDSPIKSDEKIEFNEEQYHVSIL